MKLKMLIKFDQIKVIEDFYNAYHQEQPHEQIHLDLEVSDEQLQDLVEKVYKRSYERRVTKRREFNTNAQLRQKVVTGLLKYLLLDACKFKPGKSRLKYAFMLLKTSTTFKPTET